MRITVIAIILAFAPGIALAQYNPTEYHYWTERSEPILEAALSAVSHTDCGLKKAVAVDHSLGHVYRCREVFSLTGQWLGTLQLSGWTANQTYYGATIIALVVDERTHQLLVVTSEMVKIVDGETFAEIRSIALPVYPNGHDATLSDYPWGTPAVAYNPATRILYLGMRPAPTVWALDLARPSGDPNQLVEIHLPMTLDAWGQNEVTSLGIDYSTGRLFASSKYGRWLPEMMVIDIDPARPATYHRVIDSMPVSCNATNAENGDAFVISRQRSVMYCVNVYAETLRAIDIDPARPTYKMTLYQRYSNFSWPLREEPEGVGDVSMSITYDPLRDLVYVAVSGYFYGPKPVLWAFDGATLELASATSAGDFEQDYFHEVAVDPLSGRVYFSGWAGMSGLLIYGQRAQTTVAVVADTVEAPVTIETPQVAITFADVTGVGVTTVLPIDATEANLTLPGQFSLAGAGAFEISTSAAVTAPFVLCFNASHVIDRTVFDTLVVLHGENGAWVDRTVSRDFATGTICASVASFSPFAIGRRLPVHYQISALYDQSKAARSGSTLPLKLRVLDADGTNVSSAALEVNGRRLIRIANETTGAIADAGSANPDSRFRYDATLGGYIFNLSTKGLAPGVYRLEFNAGADADVHSVFFGIK